ncbi:MAG: topoisomerase C-terminal repeat-containing protein, partial [Paracoccaceae bacterium]
RLVTAFLENYFRRYVGYNFTAQLEEELDDISGGREDYKAVLSRFWRDFSAAVAETADLRITEVLEKINEFLEPHLFPPTEDGSDPRCCRNCGTGRLSMRTARSGGAFIGCSNYPECRYTRPLAGEAESGDIAGPDGKLLGHDENGLPVSVRSGRFGPYVQLGVASEENPKPRRASIPKGMEAGDIDLERALELLSLPRFVGDHPEGGRIEASIGRYGPYVMLTRIGEDGKDRKTYANIKDPAEVLTIGMNRAVEVLAQKAARGGRGQAAKPMRELGEHPAEGGAVNVMDGRYGPYVKWQKVNATLPKDVDPESVTMEMAVDLIAQKAAKKGAKRKKAAPKKKK